MVTSHGQDEEQINKVFPIVEYSNLKERKKEE
jgi:hypothetical protein